MMLKIWPDTYIMHVMIDCLSLSCNQKTVPGEINSEVHKIICKA